MNRNHKIAVVAGDGIGPEVVPVALECLDILASRGGFSLNLKEYPQSGSHYLKTGEVLSDETLNEWRKFDALFFGAVGHPGVKPGIIEKGLLLKMRFDLDLYINLRPVKLYAGVECPLKGKTPADLDYVVVRENSGGLYTGIGGSTMKGSKDEVAVQSMVYNYRQVERCLRYAFELAMKRRKKVALVGKSNVLTHMYELWLRVYEELGAQYPEVKREYYHVDAACMFMIRNPAMFDVICTENMFGDILTDIGAETQGGMGMAASGNLNPDRTGCSMFEPIHGSAPDIAGQDKANPIAAVLSGKMMLEFLGEHAAANVLDQVISRYVLDTQLGISTSAARKKLVDLTKSLS